MWKIIKSELSYLKPWIIISCVCLVIVILIEKFRRYSMFLSFGYTIPESILESFIWGPFFYEIIVLTSIAINLILFSSHLKERRLRQLAILPVSKIRIVNARILIPLVLVTIYILVVNLDWPIIPLELFYAIRNVNQLNYEYYPYFEGESAGLVCTLVFYNMLPWLFMEKWGKYILIVLASLFLIHGYIMPIFNRELSWVIGDYLYYGFLRSGHIRTYLMGWLSVLFILTIYFSFVKRKDYLA